MGSGWPTPGLYAGAMVDMGRQLAQELTEREQEDLRAWCRTVSLLDFLRWGRAHHEAVVQYATSTPAQRMRCRKWKEPGLRPRLMWYSLYLLEAGRNVLHNAELAYNNCLGLGYRESARRAIDIALARVEPRIFEWPYDIPDPTTEWYRESPGQSSTE